MEQAVEEVQLGIKEGDKFQTYKDAESTVNSSAQKNFVRFYKREARTIKAGTRKTNRYLNPALEFYQVEWACVHGGRQFKAQGQGLRRTKTIRNEQPCPAHVRIRVSLSGNDFEVITVQNLHNHQVSRSYFDESLQEKKVPSRLRRNTKGLVGRKVNRRLIKNELEQKLDKKINLNDVTNVQPENKTQPNNDLREACEKINSKFGTDCHILVDDNNLFNGMTFCTGAMKSAMGAYPEYLCIDGTYKLPNIRATVYLLSIVNGNGECDIVAVGILTTEDKESITWLLEQFKQENPKWDKTKTIMINNDLQERDAILQCFPDARLQICIFHALKIFQSKITCQNFKISVSEKRAIFEYVQKLIYCRDDTEFFTIVDVMKKKIPTRVFEYFETNWLNIKEQWYLGALHNSFLDATNSRLETIHSKLKRAIHEQSSIGEFLDKLFITLKSVQDEQDGQLANSLNRRSTSPLKTEYEYFEYEYKTILTPYGFKMLTEQFNYDPIKVVIKDGVYICNDSSTVSYCISPSKCTCNFHLSMGLPCKHIFAVRHFLDQELFAENLIPERWRMKYLLENNGLFANNCRQSKGATNNTVNVLSGRHKKVLSREEKYRLLFDKCKEAATLGAEADGTDFTKVSDLFDRIVDMLQQNTYDFMFNFKSPVKDRAASEQFGRNLPETLAHSEDGVREHVDHELREAIQIYCDNIPNPSANEIPAYNITYYNENEDLDCGKTVTISDLHENSDYEEAEKVKFSPTNIKKRPKERETATKKRPKDKKCFKNKTMNEKRTLILSWLLSNPDVVRYKKNITTADLKAVDDIDKRILEIDFLVIKKCVPPQLWQRVIDLKQEKLKSSIWSCLLCKKTILAKERTIRCDACLYWFHATCSDCTSANRSEIWYCRNCT